MIPTWVVAILYAIIVGFILWFHYTREGNR